MLPYAYVGGVKLLLGFYHLTMSPLIASQLGLSLDKVFIVADTTGVCPQIAELDPFSMTRVFKSKLRVLTPLALTVKLYVELGV